MKLCPICATSYPADVRTCPTHGTVLVETQELPAGAMIRDCYKIVRMLGKGGMGTVYLAEHTLMGEMRALKFLSLELASNPSFVQRFLQEARAANKLRHPNVAQTMELGQTEDGSFYISMEFVDGPSLRTALNQSPGGLPLDRAIAIIRGAASGLGAAHAKHMVHRDVKPENILLAQTAEGEVAKVVDFGIVAMSDGASRLTQTGSVLLTCEYAAPEQWRGTIPSSELDGRTDLYSVGCMFFEMLTGRLPYKSETYEGWFQLHVNSQPPVPSSLRPEIAQYPGLDAVALKLLSKERDDRPANVAAFLAELDHVLAGRGGASLPSQPWTPQAAEPAGASRVQTLVENPPPGGWAPVSLTDPGPAGRGRPAEIPPGYQAAASAGQDAGQGQTTWQAGPHNSGAGAGQSAGQASGQAAGWQAQPQPAAQPGWQGQAAVQTPPQGYPAHPTPPQGYPAHATPPQGYPAQATPPQGYPAQGNPAQGQPPAYGQAPAQGYGQQPYPAQQQYGAPQQAGAYPGQQYPAQGKKKSNVGLIVGLVIAVVVVCGLGVGGAMMYLRKVAEDKKEQAASAAQNSAQSQTGAETQTAVPSQVPGTQVPAQPETPTQPLTEPPGAAEAAAAAANAAGGAVKTPAKGKTGATPSFANSVSPGAKPNTGTAAASGASGSPAQQGRDLYLKKQYAEARPALTQACGKGDAASCGFLGTMYRNKLGVDTDLTQAVSLFTKACNGNDLSGCTNLGSLYEHKLGVEQDYQQAQTLYQKACNGGEAAACNNLGVMYQKAEGVAQDYGSAAALYLKSCVGNNANGCSDLGYLYMKGLGMAKDSAKAKEYLDRGCKMGNSWGCDRLKELN